MYRLSLIIGEVYNKYLPLAEKGEVRLNLDFPDPTATVDDAQNQEIKEQLDQQLLSALKRAPKGEVTIKVTGQEIIVRDSGTTLSAPACALLSKGRVSVSSRTGFGTTVRIALHREQEPTSEPTQIAPQATSKAKTKDKLKTANKKS